MPLSSFSSLLDFAIGQQKEALSFFTSSINNLSAGGKENLETARNEAEKNIKNLETILRENITEMVMEPLEELNEADYSPRAEGANNGQAIINMLEKQKLFFQDAARVINLKDVKRLLERMSSKTELLILEIKGPDASAGVQ